ncbi:MAG TPA: LamG domain-containing protein, partial [Thermoguttaceae bacterium]|nr:LamG domain-containing protein [Thermoguttaceae bacterium]
MVFLVFLIVLGLWDLPILAAEKPPAQTAQIPFCQPWDQPYQAENAVGKHVLGLWTFDSDSNGKDQSGRGHDATLQGARLAPNGRFGGALECFPGWPVEDKPHRAFVPAKPELSPRGPFSLELWFCPKPELAKLEAEAYLVDKKYVAHADYQLVMTQPDRSGARGLRMSLGFGQESDTWYAPARRWEPGRWYHLAFTYDGQGTGVFYLNGTPISQSTHPGRQGIVPGTHGLSIGDRLGSRYAGFPGLIDQVRLCEGVLEFRPVAVETVSDRRVFLRMEPDVQLRLQIANLRKEPMEALTVRLSLKDMPPEERKLENLQPGQKAEISYRLDTRLRPDEYPLHVEIFSAGQGAEPMAAQTIRLRIVPRPAPDRMPVVMWGGRPGQPGEIERLKQIGFTHALGLGVNYASIFEAGQPIDPLPPETLETQKRLLDEALAADLTIAISLSPGSWLRSKEQFRRVGRDGKPGRKEDICALYPGLDAFCQNVGISAAKAFGRFPAFGAALVHSEVRDAAAPCFHQHDREAFRRATGLEIPPEVASPRGVDYRRLAQFPQDRVIPDDHPLLVYYRWYWKQGDGWNGLNTALCRGLRTGLRPDFWIWHDPAVRVAKVYGSGGQVDVLSQWTYSYPDPIRIGLATDELLTMADGANPSASRANQSGSEGNPSGPGANQAGPGGPQQVMKMTQIIWYRSQTAPEPKPGQDAPSYQARWEIEQPDAPFITIAPMHLREAFWTKIARPIQGIMYHGWESLVPCEGHSGYRYTHPQTQHELARLIREVVEPLGPMLRQVPAARSDVVMLESFTSEMFAGRGTFGWGGSWAGDCWHVLQWAHLQTDILFDETIAAARKLAKALCDS